jgi:hypothetical protein
MSTNTNPINGVPFGQERTAKEHLERAEWERDQAAQIRARRQPVGYEHLVQAHEDSARAYERRAKEIGEGMVATARAGEARGKSRAELVDVARAAAAAVFAPRKIAPTEAAMKKAREVAFKAIQRHDRQAGTATHPVAAYSHGIAELASEGTEEARQRWEMLHASTAKLRGGRAHSSIKSDGWTTEHKKSGTTVIERNIHGARLTVVPENWTDPAGPAHWSVTRGRAGQAAFDHKRGNTSSLTAAKEAATRAAKTLAGASHATMSTTTSPAFEAAKAEGAALEAEVADAEAALKAIPGVSSGRMGLTPEHVRTSPQYRSARARFDKAFARLRAFNGVFVKRFAKELRAERDARARARERR